jgi:hypothetical protein
VSRVPRPARPLAKPATTSTAAHAPSDAAVRARTRDGPASMAVSRPASSVTEHEGTSALQSRDRAKYAIHAALLTVVSAAHDQETPAVSRVALSFSTCGRNCGIPKAVAATGA